MVDPRTAGFSLFNIAYREGYLVFFFCSLHLASPIQLDEGGVFVMTPAPCNHACTIQTHHMVGHTNFYAVIESMHN